MLGNLIPLNLNPIESSGMGGCPDDRPFCFDSIYIYGKVKVLLFVTKKQCKVQNNPAKCWGVDNDFTL